jgi:hypothetical protein
MSNPTSSSHRSPFAGCAILIIGFVILAVLLSVSFYSLFSQNREIDKFTKDQALQLPIISHEENRVALDNLAAKSKDFVKLIRTAENEKIELRLNVDELNLALSVMESLKELKPFFHVKELRDGFIIADHTRPINGLPGSGKVRYLNGEIYLRPSLVEKEIILTIEKILVQHAEVPEPFIKQIPPYRLGLAYQNDKNIGAVFKSITSIEVINGDFILKKIPGESPATATNQQVDSAFLRIFRLLICGFLLIAGLAIFLGLRTKAKREKSSVNSTL